MPDQAPQTLDEILDSSALYEKDGYGGYQVNRDYAKAAITALMLDAVGEDEVEDTDLSKSAKSRWGVRARNRVRAEIRNRIKKLR